MLLTEQEGRKQYNGSDTDGIGFTWVRFDVSCLLTFCITTTSHPDIHKMLIYSVKGQVSIFNLFQITVSIICLSFLSSLEQFVKNLGNASSLVRKFTQLQYIRILTSYTIKVFIDAPHLMHPVDLVGPSSINALESLGAAEAANADQDASLMPRAWWKSNAEKTKAVGLAESLEYVKWVLKERRFDVSESCVSVKVLSSNEDFRA